MSVAGREKQQAAGLLRRHGLRVTTPRLAVLRCLAEADRHLSAEGVLERLRVAGCRCARATVYNVLNDFAARGLLRTVSIPGGPTWFDPVTEPHPHLYREDTGELVDLPADALPDFRALGLPPELEVAGISLVVHARPRDTDGAGRISNREGGEIVPPGIRTE